MKILVDGRMLAHTQTTGVERYTVSLLAALRKKQAAFDVRQPQTTNRYLQHYWEHVLLPKYAKGYDLLFCPGNIAPAWKPEKCKYVVTLHDISFLTYKSAYSAFYRAYHSVFLGRTMAIADRIITDSYHEKDAISRKFPEYAEKIRVIYIGVDDIFNQSKPIDKKEDYILYVGSLNPRKNFSGVINAFNKIAHKIPHRLVIAGARQDLYRNLSLKNSERIIYPGYIDEKGLVDLYQKASLFVFPSFYEGFGLPPLEAMACGCPVVTSNSSSLPEVVGDAALKVDPNDTDAIAEAMFTVLTKKDIREQLVEKGRKRAKEFSWDKTAEETIAVFRECQ